MQKRKCRICGNDKDVTSQRYCANCIATKQSDIEKYEQKLETRRRYKRGEPITTLSEFAESEFLYIHGKIYHIAFLKSWQFYMVENLIKNKQLLKAIKKGD